LLNYRHFYPRHGGGIVVFRRDFARWKCTAVGNPSCRWGAYSVTQTPT